MALEIKVMYKQKSTWAGLLAIVGSIGGYATGTLDLQAALSSLIGGLVLIFLPEFKKPV